MKKKAINIILGLLVTVLIISLVIFLGGNVAVKEGDKVKVDYTGTFENGTVFDTSEGRRPLEFTVGSGQVVKGFDEAVIGMEKGEEKEITLQPSEAYGDPNPLLIKKLPKEQLPKDAEVGSILTLSLSNSQQIPAKVTEIKDEEVILDLNHPLAGKVLKFKIKVVGIFWTVRTYNVFNDHSSILLLIQEKVPMAD